MQEEEKEIEKTRSAFELALNIHQFADADSYCNNAFHRTLDYWWITSTGNRKDKNVPFTKKNKQSQQVVTTTFGTYKQYDGSSKNPGLIDQYQYLESQRCNNKLK